MVVTSGYRSGEFQFNFRGSLNVGFRFTKFVLGNSGGKRFVILVEDFNNGGLSSITVRKEY